MSERSLEEVVEMVNSIIPLNKEANMEETMKEEGFQVTDPFDVGDVSEVSLTVPTTQGVLFEVKNAKISNVLDDAKQLSKKNLSLRLDIVEGIDENGKFRGKPMFQDITVWVSEAKKAQSDFFRSGSYLFQWKILKIALGFDPKEITTFNDEFLMSLIGRRVRANIKAEKVRRLNKENGEWEDTTELRNVIDGFKKVEE